MRRSRSTTISNSDLRRKLLAWYDAHRRDLPWRRAPTLYQVLVSEFMLQQTRVDQVLPYYARWLARFPDLESLAAASLQDVLKLWEGLGYYRRARFLYQAAQRLAPLNTVRLEDLESCPGIGPYTLAAVGSIALGARLPVVDGNTKRVAARMLALDENPASLAGNRQVRAALETWLDPQRPGDGNQALMELGALVCTPRAPKCEACPWALACRARAESAVDRYPVRSKRRPRPHQVIAAAVIRRADGRFLIAQRKSGGLLGDFWEFPGGKREGRESLRDCARREVREELGVSIEVGRRLARIEHGYTHFTITLHIFEARYVSGRPRALGCQAFRWVRARELGGFPFPRANQDVVRELIRVAAQRWIGMCQRHED